MNHPACLERESTACRQLFCLGSKPRNDPDVILDVGYARRSPGGPFRFFSLSPSPHVSAQNYLAISCFHGDLFCVYPCSSMKRFLDCVNDVTRSHTRLNRYQTGHALRREKIAYLNTLLPMLASLRRASG